MYFTHLLLGRLKHSALFAYAGYLINVWKVQTIIAYRLLTLEQCSWKIIDKCSDWGKYMFHHIFWLSKLKEEQVKSKNLLHNNFCPIRDKDVPAMSCKITQSIKHYETNFWG